MPDIEKSFVAKALKRLDVDSFLQKELERAGYVKVELQKTPLGTNVTIYAERPGMVIGRHGSMVHELTQRLEKMFGIEKPQIGVAPIEVPELNAKIMAQRIKAALERGIHFRRAAYIALNQIMEAGALGGEVRIKGKLRTERARYEKLRAGIILKAGQISQEHVDTAVSHAYLKQGKIGIKVRIVLPSALKALEELDKGKTLAKMEGAKSGDSEG
ncbi:MAG: 30S ribosomal protein S3 [Candidatus Nezhaarchaeota archaeon]|nr:30S ribosomal protein S3 [Candidatus Nezhaarchaeota archaeon]MCX8141899.1 30S ribosomal protein S3 [Candidatus Nezhaarchaeota archaeon]MDW8050320.1 30S ribosomal protein S3 [Nitrososphaerota archaeon]